MKQKLFYGLIDTNYSCQQLGENHKEDENFQSGAIRKGNQTVQAGVLGTVHLPYKHFFDTEVSHLLK